MRCKLSTGAQLDFVVINMFRRSAWKPRTVWDGCLTYDQGHKLSFVHLDDVFRGVIMCPTFGSEHEHTYYLLDDVDNDMFLRLNQL